MLVRAFSRLVVLIGPILVLGYLLFIYVDGSTKVTHAISWSKEGLNNVGGYAPSRLHNPGLSLDEAEPIALENDNVDAVLVEVSTSTLEPTPSPVSSSPIALGDDNIDALPAEAPTPTPELPPSPTPVKHGLGHVVVNSMSAQASNSVSALPPLPTSVNHEVGHAVVNPVPVEASTSTPEPAPSPIPQKYKIGPVVVDPSVYLEVFSVSTKDRKYFIVDFGPDHPTLNPNTIPHFSEKDKWIIVAQRTKNSTSIEVFEEVYCTAAFQADGSLRCTTPPTPLPVAPTKGGNCKGDIDYFDLVVGPHDMRVSYGPHAPISIFGSQSVHACFGMFAQDFRTLVEGFPVEESNQNFFMQATDLQRPPPWHELEKNWFLFWDIDGQAYVHQDIAPKRVFTQLLPDGSVGPDLAPLAAFNDDLCMGKYVPKPGPRKESLHQATNSLSITLCKRSDPSCHPSDSNTFIMTIFQHKIVHGYHAAYQPYILLFKQSAPFAVYAISTKPIWIHGRGYLTEQEYKAQVPAHEGWPKEPESDMFYVTSMSWKMHGLKYHGYVDDVVFLSFGIEDVRSAAIDVLAGDLLQDLGLCGL